jgi:hypothetical protein
VLQSFLHRTTVMQKADFLTQIIDPSRAKLIRLFTLNDKVGFALPEIAKRVGLPIVAAKKEVKTLMDICVVREAAGEGKNTKERAEGTRYFFNEKFRYANALSTFVHEVSPERFNEVEKALRGAGRLNAIVLSGIFIGDVRRPADLIIVGDSVNEKRLEKAVKSFEPRYGREIRYALFSTPEFRYRLTIHDKLVRDTLDYPHRLLLNKNNLI